MKKCSMCKKEKELTEFYKNSTRKDGVNSHCKNCHNEYRKKYYAKNKDKERRINSEYKKKNETLVNCIICKKEIYRRNRDLEKTKDHFCSYSCRSKFMDKGIIRNILKGVRKRAKVKKFEFNIDYNFLYDLFYNKQNKKCAVTGVDIILMKDKDIGNMYEKASLDRIDNSKGYIKGNVRFVVLGINYMKNRYDDLQLFELLKRIKNAGIA